MSHFDYHRPDSLGDALQLKQGLPDARWVAGGTDLLVKLKSGTASAGALISLRGLNELRGIDTSGGGAVIGALTPLSDVLAHPVVAERYPVLVRAIADIASPQIRNAATLGGNFCNASPCADTPPPLLVLEARVRIEGPAGAREVPADAFFLGPGQTCLGPDEILAAVVLDPPRPGAVGAFLKKGRVRVDIALVNVAVLVQLEGGSFAHVRVAAGAVAPTPLRLRAVEELLEGQRATPELLVRADALAAESVAPITDVRASAGYRRRITGVYVRRCLEQLCNEGSAG
ncbi:MAG: xanthine dehydrogenase family protein subunit M [Planctomycetota bacterium]|nr:MAG: xanthine dehydrogenase family protein subunit M [Planctomycetota bacterium]